MGSPDSDLVDYIAEEVPTLERDEDLFTGPVRAIQAEVPPSAVFCLLAGGTGPEPYIGNQADFRRHAVQVRIRHEDLDEGRELADAVFAAVHRAPIEGYAYCLAKTEPTYMGQDENYRLFEWSINVEMGRKV